MVRAYKSISTSEAACLSKEVARLIGETNTQAVIVTLNERLARVRHCRAGLKSLVHVLARAGLEAVTGDAEQTGLARQGYAQFAKGRHPAGLNNGDCLAYALRIARGEPLPFEGADFAKTDVVPALPA